MARAEFDELIGDDLLRQVPGDPAGAASRSSQGYNPPSVSPLFSGFSTAKAGGSSPKYAFQDVASRYANDRSNLPKILAELQQKYPQYYSGWTIADDDKFQYTGDYRNLDKSWGGWTLYDVVRGGDNAWSWIGKGKQGAPVGKDTPGKGSFDTLRNGVWGPSDANLAANAARGSATAGAGGQFTDPATQMYEDLVLDRIDQLLAAVKRPDDDRYRTAALDRVDDLTNNPPYTTAEEQALITQMRDPLTQARDSRQTYMKEIMGARNIGPTSGLFLDQVYNEPEEDYTRALASGTNDLAVRAIDEKQARTDEALDILADLVGLGRDARNENENRSREAVTTGAILPDLSERRLRLLMDTLGYGGTDLGGLSSSLLDLTRLNQNQSQFNAGRSSSNAVSWGAILGYLAGSPLLNR